LIFSRQFAAQMRRLALVLALGAGLVWLATARAHAACFLIFCDHSSPLVQKGGARVKGAPDLRGMVAEAAVRAGVPSRIALAVVRLESGFQARARSSAGALGLGQIKCATARGLGFHGSCGKLFEPATNLSFSMRYLRLALNRGGGLCASLGLYERGVFARPRCTSYGRKALRLIGA
jgi:soluble lytic murein transglycosylase-like protein